MFWKAIKQKGRRVKRRQMGGGMLALDRTLEALQKAGIPCKKQETLARYTTIKIGGPAALLCAPQNEKQLARAVALARENGVPYFFLGKGSNVLFRDAGYNGLVIHVAADMAGIRTEGELVYAGAGASLMDVCLAARDAGLAGLEFAYGIPGSVGGAVYMNAGAYGGELKSVVHSVVALDDAQNIVTLDAGALAFGYRSSAIQKGGWCVLSACFALKRGNVAEITEKMEANMQSRREKQPLEYPSAGSAFKRPPGAYAGALIDQSGLRGYRVGDAAISEKHCGFIVNLGAATCSDVLALADHVASRVKEETGYTLEKEILVVDG